MSGFLRSACRVLAAGLRAVLRRLRPRRRSDPFDGNPRFLLRLRLVERAFTAGLAWQERPGDRVRMKAYRAALSPLTGPESDFVRVKVRAALPEVLRKV